MKRFLGAAVAVLVLVGVVGTGVAHASTVKSGETATVAAGEIVNGTLYAAGTNVKIEGTVKGDVFCAGQNVEITGMVEGDVICAAQVLTLKGAVAGDIRVAAQNLNIQNVVDGSATVAGQNIALFKEAVIGHDLTAYGMDLRLEGAVNRDVLAGAESVEFKGHVGRDSDVRATTVTVDQGATLAGNLVYTSKDSADIAKGASIEGKTDHRDPPQTGPQSRGEQFAARAISASYFLGSFLLLGLVLRLAAPRSFVTVQKFATANPLAVMGVGAAAVVLPPIIAFLLLLPAIGLVLSLSIFLIWVLGMLVGVVYGSHALGRFVLAHTKQPSQWVTVTAIAVGVLLLAIAMLVPVLGALVTGVVMVWGLGAILRSFYKGQQPVHVKK